MKTRLLFETMQATDADMVKWCLDEHEIAHQLTGRSHVTEFQAVPIQIFVSEDDYERALLICKERELIKKKVKREYTKEEKLWLYYLISIVPTIFLIVKAVPSFLFQSISYGVYIALGMILYKRYKASTKKIHQGDEQ